MFFCDKPWVRSGEEKRMPTVKGLSGKGLGERTK